jgi:hypothetical protein
MKITKGRYIYITGSYRDTLNVGEKSIQSNGEEDIFIARLENCNQIAPKFKTPELLCEGKNITLDAGPGFVSYNWNDGMSRISSLTVDKGGFYTLELVSKNGCTIYDTIEVNEIPVPDVFIGNDTTIADTSFLVLHAGKKFTDYLWSNGRKDSVNVIRGFDYGEGKNLIWVKIHDKNGCEGYDEIFVTFFKTVKSAASQFLENNCFVYPNPTDDNLKVYLTTSLKTLDLTLYNQLGVEVATRSITGYKKDATVIFSLGSLSPGLYTLIIRAEDGFATKKIVLQ